MSPALPAAQQRWVRALERSTARLAELPPPPVAGRLTRMVGLTLEASGCQAAVGDRCEIVTADDMHIGAEVVGFAGENLYLMPTGDIHGLKPGARVLPRPGTGTVGVGRGLLGRVVDGACEPLDGRGPIQVTTRVRLTGTPINPLARRRITEPLDVGVRAINGLLTVGRGQRIGLFAGSGVGKSVLLGMMARYTQADVIVVGLIGERGREVKEFIETILGPSGLARAVVVARDLHALGFSIVATKGTAAAIAAGGVPVKAVNKVKDGRPHIVDMVKGGEIQLVFTTVDETRTAIADSRHIRQAALAHRVTYYTSMAGCEAAVEGMKHEDDLVVMSLQALHAELAS